MSWPSMMCCSVVVSVGCKQRRESRYPADPRNPFRSRNGLVGNARVKGLLDKPGVPIVCGNSSGNMGDRNRTNWLTVGESIRRIV
jgi:hypothetical protein